MNRTRMMVGSTFRYSARPAETPAIFRFLRLRYSLRFDSIAAPPHGSFPPPRPPRVLPTRQGRTSPSAALHRHSPPGTPATAGCDPAAGLLSDERLRTVDQSSASTRYRPSSSISRTPSPLPSAGTTRPTSPSTAASLVGL